MARPLPLLLAASLAVTTCSCSLISSLISVAIPVALAKLTYSCLPEGALIDTPDGPRAIETLKAGDIVMGFGGEPVKILQKHGYVEDPAQIFYIVTFEDGSSVELCGRHRIDGVRAEDLTLEDRISGNAVASIERFTGVERSYDLLTEDEGYQVEGIPVNSMIEEMAQARRRDLDETKSLKKSQ